MQITNARYVEPSHTLYDVTVTLDGEPLDYTIHPADNAPLAVTIRETMAADPLPIAAYVAPPPTVPQVVSARQARLALLAAGLLDDVEAALAAAGRAAQIEWEYATEVRRDHPVLAAMASQLSLAPEALDNLFTQAATL